MQAARLVRARKRKRRRCARTTSSGAVEGARGGTLDGTMRRLVAVALLSHSVGSARPACTGAIADGGGQEAVMANAGERGGREATEGGTGTGGEAGGGTLDAHDGRLSEGGRAPGWNRDSGHVSFSPKKQKARQMG